MLTVFAAPIVRYQIVRSRDRIGTSRVIMAMSRSTIDKSRAAIEASRIRLMSLNNNIIEDFQFEKMQTFLHLLDNESIDQILEDFCAAYKEAVATGNDQAADMIGQALMILGRHVARQLGPRAAGVSLN